MASLRELVNFAQQFLRVSEIPDYAGAMNGLQVENASGQVTKVAAAVDATLPVVQKAVRGGADLLVVHHGLFWSGAQSLTGAVFEKFRLAIENNLAIYSVHIPLDVHEEIGNNVLLAKALGFEDSQPFFLWKGILLGRMVELGSAISPQELVSRVEAAVGGSFPVCMAGPKEVRRVGIITGGSGGEVAAVAREGVDAFVCGEGPHWSFGAAEEAGIHVLYAGHYATETFGVNALARRWHEEFGVETFFVDHPSGL